MVFTSDFPEYQWNSDDFFKNLNFDFSNIIIPELPVIIKKRLFLYYQIPKRKTELVYNKDISLFMIIPATSLFVAETKLKLIFKKYNLSAFSFVNREPILIKNIEYFEDILNNKYPDIKTFFTELMEIYIFSISTFTSKNAIDSFIDEKNSSQNIKFFRYVKNLNNIIPF